MCFIMPTLSPCSLQFTRTSSSAYDELYYLKHYLTQLLYASNIYLHSYGLSSTSFRTLFIYTIAPSALRYIPYQILSW